MSDMLVHPEIRFLSDSVFPFVLGWSGGGAVVVMKRCLPVMAVTHIVYEFQLSVTHLDALSSVLSGAWNVSLLAFFRLVIRAFSKVSLIAGKSLHLNSSASTVLSTIAQ